MVASISVARNQNYLLKDYYHKDQEAPGVWIGSGSEKLGLEGEVAPQEFSKVWIGENPGNGGGALVQNAGAKTRKAGWDITYSAPKSVSILWGIGDDQLKADIEQAHHQAVLDAHKYLEDNAAFTRRGKGGEVHEKIEGLISASFQHGVSREGDLQLHTHTMNFNAGVRKDGSTGSIESKYLYDRKMAAGAVYRATLSHGVEELGFKIKPTEKGLWEIEGVSQESIEHFSKRSQQIKQDLADNQLKDSAKNREKAALKTRKTEVRESSTERKTRWKQEAAELGITEESIRELRGNARERSEFEQRRNKELVREAAIAKSTEQQSVFKEKDLDLLIAKEAGGKGMTYQDIKGIKQELFSSRELVELQGDKTDRYFTTTRQLDMEQELHDRAQYLSEDKSHTVNSKHIFKAVQERPSITPEQQRALTHVTAPGALKIVSGRAGTGKSFFLGAAGDAWKGSGYKVQGLALSGKAASGLQDGSGIQSRTLDSFFASVDRHNQQDHSKGFITKKSVLVVDEAGMIDTKRMTRLLADADEAGAKVVLVGDARQLQPIQNGGAFDSLSKEHKSVELKEIMRQKGWAKDATNHFAEGRATQGLAEYDKRGLITVRQSNEQLYQEVIKDWSAAGAVKEPQKHLILGTTNIEVDSLNALAQEKRLHAQQVNKDRHSFINGKRVYEQDRILFRKNDRGLKVNNGMTGTIKSIDNLKGAISVTLDNGQQRQFNQAEYDQLSLGYALTTHKAQGVTADKVYAVAGGSRLQDQELSYVQASRSREQTRFYTRGENHQDGVKNLEKKMVKSNQKKLAREHIKEAEHQKLMTVGQSRGVGNGGHSAR